MVHGKGPLSSPGACNGLAHVHTDLNTEERPDVQASQLLTLGLILVFILACSSMWSERAKEKGEEGMGKWGKGKGEMGKREMEKGE